MPNLPLHTPPACALIIDDDPLYMIVAEELLRTVGIETVLTAEDGRKGLAVLRAQPEVDLILCDLNMPNLDGVGVVRALGEMGFDGGLVVISSEAADIIKTVRSIAELVGVEILGGLKKPLRESDLRAVLSAERRGRRYDAAASLTRAELLAAMADNTIVPVYQPQLDLTTMTVSGVELLLRRVRPDGTLEGPAAVLESAEQHGLMTKLTLALIERMVIDVLRWRPRGLVLPISINLSPASLSDLSLPEQLVKRFAACGIEQRDVTLEITENRLLDFRADTLEVLSRLRILGFSLSVDDFGTGATSIEQLRRFPFNELKIDRSFVQNAHNDDFAMETVKTSTRFAKMLGLTTVAEGVETAQDLKIARACEADVAQGYLIGKPMTADALASWYKTGTVPAEVA